MFPLPDILNKYPHGRFVLANLAAKRAKMLKEGAISPIVDSESKHPLTIALLEIAREHVKPRFKDDLPVVEQHDEVAELIAAHSAHVPIVEPTLGVTLEDEELPAPSLADAEFEDEEADETELTAETLSDVFGDVEDETEEEPVPVADDPDSMSLTDIETQENLAEEDEEEDV
ncbi:MAG: DNA-directed RNA polymerase subunit omega [Fimbriimonadales bacterium]|nr:DNA-directed RNA polymerase subunit omega [Fimbriimonadales bacterium]